MVSFKFNNRYWYIFITEFNANISQLWNILEYFNHFFYPICKPNLVSKEILYKSTKAIYKALVKISDLIPVTLNDLNLQNDDEIDDRLQLTKDRIRTSLLPYVYLLAKLATVCETEALKTCVICVYFIIFVCPF